MAAVQALPGSHLGLLESRSVAERRALHREPGFILTVLLCAIYASVFIALGNLKYVSFQIGGDTADYTQMLWNTIHGQLLGKTSLYAAVNHLRGGHIEPILLLLAPLYKLFPDPRTLLFAQTCALAVGGVLIYPLARVQGRSQRIAVGLVVFYLVYPIVHYADITDFHPDPLAIPAVLGALLAFDTQRWGLLALCITLVLLTKEQMVLIVFGLGVYWGVFRGAPRVGALVVAAVVVYMLAVMLPWYLATASQFTHDYNSFFGDALQAWQGGPGAAHDLGSRVQRIVALLTQGFRGENELWALLPSGFLFLLDSSAIVLMLPLAGLYVSDPMTNYYFYHHYIICVPVLMYGTMRALDHRRLLPRSNLIVTLLIVWACTLDYSYSYNPLNLMHWMHQPSLLTASRARAQAALIRGIPPAATIDADYSLAAHLANRTYLFQLQDVRQASLAPYVLLDLHADYHDPPAWMVGMDQTTLAYMREIGGFRVWRADPVHGLYVYLNCARFPATSGCRRG